MASLIRGGIFTLNTTSPEWRQPQITAGQVTQSTPGLPLQEGEASIWWEAGKVGQEEKETAKGLGKY